MATAKQIAWRAKFARLYGGGKKRSRKRARVKTMARFRKRGRGSGRRNMLMSGVMPMKFGLKGVAGAAIAGGVAGYIASRYLPNIAGKYQPHAAGFLVGGVPGVVGALILPGIFGGMLGGQTTSSSSANALG
jgi:hypothetical protein